MKGAARRGSDSHVSTDFPAHLGVPDRPRKLRMHTFQLIGIPLLILIPVLALLNVFGVTRDYAEDSSAEVTLRVEFPTRYRYKQIENVQVEVENLSQHRIDTLIVAFDRTYVQNFSTPTFIPSPSEPFEVEVSNMEPGSTRRIWAELQGESYGRHTGWVAAYRKGGIDTARVDIATILFP